VEDHLEVTGCEFADNNRYFTRYFMKRVCKLNNRVHGGDRLKDSIVYSALEGWFKEAVVEDCATFPIRDLLWKRDVGEPQGKVPLPLFRFVRLDF